MCVSVCLSSLLSLLEGVSVVRSFVITEKEEVGSPGNTGMEGRSLEHFMEDLCDCFGVPVASRAGADDEESELFCASR